MNTDEYARLKELSIITGLKMEPVLRDLLMGVELRPRPPDTYAALLRELNAIGTNVNQIAHYVNANRSADRVEIDKATKLVQQAWRLVKEAL